MTLLDHTPDTGTAEPDPTRRGARRDERDARDRRAPGAYGDDAVAQDHPGTPARQPRSADASGEPATGRHPTGSPRDGGPGRRRGGPGPGRQRGGKRPRIGPASDVGPDGALTWRGMRIRRVRLVSVAQLATVFFALAFGVVLGTLVVVWNVILSLGFVADAEDLVVTALGLDAFTIDGDALFHVALIGTAALCAFGWLVTLLLAWVYNATSAVFGGLALDTGPIARRRRIYSPRQRRFVTVQG